MLEGQARAGHNFDPTDRQYFFIFPAYMGSFLWVLHIFWKHYFVFLQKFFFQNPTSLFFM